MCIYTCLFICNIYIFLISSVFLLRKHPSPGRTWNHPGMSGDMAYLSSDWQHQHLSSFHATYLLSASRVACFTSILAFSSTTVCRVWKPCYLAQWTMGCQEMLKRAFQWLGYYNNVWVDGGKGQHCTAFSICPHDRLSLPKRVCSASAPWTKQQR